MKRSGNNTWLLLLMIISQIMLTGLIVEWLRSQWMNEKASLQEDLHLKFIESTNQLMDTMLVKHLIVPVLNDTSANEDQLVTFREKAQSENSTGRHITTYIKDTNNINQTMVTVTIPDTERVIRQEDIAYRSYDSTQRKMLLRSVRLIIKHTEDSTGKLNRLNQIIAGVPDTSLLKNIFEEKLRKEGNRFDVIWISGKIKTHSDITGPLMYFNTDFFEKPLGVKILHYQSIILSRISAQIIFALILLLSTASAFFFTYRSLKKQEALNSLRNDFISNISHELKTPVSTVSVALEALMNFDRRLDPAKSNEYLDIAFNEMKRLDKLISQVLNTSLLENHSEYLSPEETDLVGLTREVLDSMQARFAQKGAKVELFTKEETIYLKLDKLHIHGVLINLLDNSLKYCHEDPVIIISIKSDSASVLMTISDNGPGIPGEYIPKVFDKFFRVPTGDIHNIKGYGLGLSFAELVMKHHSGSISVRNKDEGGCEFILTFRKLL
jgi:two-component system phosphate regulon sensor histidine kinase PhoR